MVAATGESRRVTLVGIAPPRAAPRCPALARAAPVSAELSRETYPVWEWVLPAALKLLKCWREKRRKLRRRSIIFAWG